ncbi:MarR family winged helix-turn-helix transcriptional regulator [Haliovirga abyssi]|uniref:MarR family transcriptional regulator n=1 Tax=Haliovirga abyssi TaxID=2996794 RepID=A0AAU9D5W5_9FUSO|nr:MarR family transcriptional regulator [Haliovirga abyssi]BDU49953.1 MarR family transcriptional regulator [Haliovirga abyssi]
MNIAKNSLGRQISRIAFKLREYINSELKDYNISGGKIHFLMKIQNEDGMCQEKLTEILKVDKATTGRAIKKLVDLGYVTRIKDEKDKRYYRLHLTESGKNIANIGKKVLKETSEMLESGFEDEEKIVIRKLLSKININLETARGGQNE